VKYQRELLKNVEGYTPGEQPKGGGVIKLNTNENPYPPSPKALEALHALGPEALRKYPDPVFTAFRSACAARYGAPGPEWIMAGNGMDELLALALRTFVDPGDTVVATYPTYSLYETLCALHGAKIAYIDLDEDFAFSEATYAARGRMFLLTRPNAPTGVAASRASVERLVQSFDGIVVIDEAYVDFAEDSCADFPQRFDNVIVMRTFSKSFSLAGMRIGAAIARPELINEFLKTKDSYNMNAVALAVGLAAMDDYAYMQASAARVKQTRARLAAALQVLGFRVPASQTNFLLAHWDGAPSAKAIMEALKARNILVRYFNHRRLENALRITIGTDEECDALLAALRDILGA
jgi:histidinol-phosphate aminotransferase